MAKKTSRSRATRARRTSATAMPASQTPWWAIVVAVLLFAGLIAGIGYELTRDRDTVEPLAQGDSVLVTVNGNAITQSRLDFHYKLLPERYRETLSREEVLEELIAEELIIQAATKEGIAASPEDVHARVQDILAQSDLTISELEENLAGFNVTTEEFEGLIGRQIALERYRAAHLAAAPAPTEEEIATRYAENIAQFAVPERVTARHVLIRSDREDAALIAKGVYDDVRAGADFCAYVRNESDDMGRKETCGEYAFSRGEMVPEFEEAAFGMQDGGVALIQTQYGYHVIERLSLADARTLTLDEAREGIAMQLRGEASSALYRDLVAGLREQALIVYPSADGISGMIVAAEPDVVVVPVDPVAPVAVVEPAQVVPNEPVAPVEPVVVEPSEPVAPAQSGSTARIVAREEPVTSPADAADIAAVLSCVAMDATLYGTQWSSDTRAARELFSDAGVALTYVQCDGGACSDDGVGAYPTWVIDGERFVGRLTLEQLRRAANC